MLEAFSPVSPDLAATARNGVENLLDAAPRIREKIPRPNDVVIDRAVKMDADDG